MADLREQLRAALDGMTEGPDNLRTCSGCEVDCYCQTCLRVVDAVRAMIEAHPPYDLTDDECRMRCVRRGTVVCLGEDHRAHPGFGERYWPCPTVRAAAKVLGIAVD